MTLIVKIITERCRQEGNWYELNEHNQFDPLENNENPNRFKTWATVMVPNTPNQEILFPLPIWRENDNPIRNKVIWLRKVIKPIVRDYYPDSTVFVWSITMDPGILHNPS